jgi:hypothetical protein
MDLISGCFAIARPPSRTESVLLVGRSMVAVVLIPQSPLRGNLSVNRIERATGFSKASTRAGLNDDMTEARLVRIDTYARDGVEHPLAAGT